MEIISCAKAKEQGLRYYFTGMPCKNGHVSQRLVVNRHCLECHRDANRVENMSIAQVERLNDRARFRGRVENLTTEQIARIRERNKLCNMSKERAEKVRAKMRASSAARKELEAVPGWANLKAIRAIYKQARELTERTGIPHHVDHEIPLRGKLVCGLHVETNLRSIPARDNLTKSNKF